MGIIKQQLFVPVTELDVLRISLIGEIQSANKNMHWKCNIKSKMFNNMY